MPLAVHIIETKAIDKALVTIRDTVRSEKKVFFVFFFLLGLIWFQLLSAFVTVFFSMKQFVTLRRVKYNLSYSYLFINSFTVSHVIEGCLNYH